MSAQFVLMPSMVPGPADTETAVRFAHSLQHDLLTEVQLLAFIARSIGSIAQYPASELCQSVIFAVPAVFIQTNTRIWRTPNLRSTTHSTHGITGSSLREIYTSSATYGEG